MCFFKSSPAPVIQQQVAQEPVERRQADANATKNSKIEGIKSGYKENLKTAPMGLSDEAQVQKKTLLGE